MQNLCKKICSEKVGCSRDFDLAMQLENEEILKMNNLNEFDYNFDTDTAAELEHEWLKVK